MGNDSVDPSPTEVIEPVDGESRQGLAAAFTKHMHRTSGGRLGPKVWAVVLAVLLVAGVAILVGVLTKPKAAAAATASRAAVRSTTTAPPPNTTLPYTTLAPAAPAYVPPPGGAPAYVPPAVPAYNPPPVVRVPAAPVPAPAYQPPAPVAQPAPAPAQQPAPRPTGPAFSATTGYGCAESSSLVFTQHGFYSSGDKGWLRVNGGAYKGPTCNGTFDAMPMSGSATSDDKDNWASWQFRTGTVTSGNCFVSVFIPIDGSIEHVGGNPSVYSIYDGFDTTGTAPFGTQINQAANQGKWVTAQVHITHGAVAVLLHSRGVDFTSKGPDFAHHAVAQVHVDCYNA